MVKSEHQETNVEGRDMDYQSLISYYFYIGVVVGLIASICRDSEPDVGIIYRSIIGFYIWIVVVITWPWFCFFFGVELYKDVKKHINKREGLG